MKKIGFIGVGVMGKSMARNLMNAGYELQIYTRTKEKASELINAGAKWCDTIKECVASVDAVISIIGYPKDVEEVYLGKDGILSFVKPGTYVIDMTTSSPNLAEKIYKAAKEKGIFALDAPVSGGDDGAKAGTLSIMVGGDEKAYNDCLEVFKFMGKTIIYEGSAGKGQHTKMANQIAIAGAISGVAEAFSYAKAKKLNLETLFDSISMGAAASYQMQVNGKKMIQKDFEPGFFIKHFIKDLNIAAKEAKDSQLDLPILDDTLITYEKLSTKGFDNLGTQAIIKEYDQE
jgi:3-hydroxyisobutyrate dehydrogenase/2-hydroxy-3-oxopropionate reductase